MRAEQIAKTTAVVKGRCVDGKTGKPLAACTVTVDGRPGNSGLMAMHGKVQWKDPEPVTTGEDGRFEIRFVPPPPFQHSITILRENCYPRTGRFGAFTPGQIEDLGDVRLYPGFFVRGRVVDTNGVPVPRVSVGFTHLCLPIGMQPGSRVVFGMRMAPPRHIGANSSRYGTSAADGTFVSRVPLPPGSWPIRLSARGRSLISPKQVTIPSDGDLTGVVVVIKEEPSLSGIVVDETGKPVRGVYLKAQQKRAGQMASGYSRRDGSFQIYRYNSGSADVRTVRIEVVDSKSCEPPQDFTKPYAWGTKDIRITLRRALSFSLVVVEKGTGRPVERFAIECHAKDSRSSMYHRGARLGGQHKGGRVVVEGVWRGTNVLRVIPKDPRLAVPDIIEFDSTDGNAGPAKVEIERLKPLKVTVTDAKGQRVNGCRVELIRPGSGNSFFIVVNPRLGTMAFSSDPTVRFPTLLYATKTNGLGQCVVYGLDGRDDLILRVGSGAAAHVQADISIGGNNLRVDVKLD